MNVIIFNRVAKAGSQSMMKLMKLLGRLNEYQVTIQGGANHHNLLPLPAELAKAERIANLPDETIYIEHVNYMNFTKFGLPQPIYINLVRDPVERVISWFYYIRGSYKNAIFYRHHSRAEFKGEEWFKKDFGTCVRTGDPECIFKQHSVKQLDFRSQALFFCGNEPNCLPFNSASAVQVAKSNIEKYYAVVGSWEDTNVTLTVLEKFIPRYFSGAKLLFEIHNEQITNKNKNIRKPKIDEDVKEILRKNFTEEYDFYYFCKQRLYKQYISVKLNHLLSK